VITLFVLSFYLLVEWKTFVKLASSPFSGSQEKKVSNLIIKIEKGLGAWVRGQLALSIIVGVVTYIGLTILAVPYALPLALIAGIFEIIPLIGPIISAIPAILIGLTVSPAIALAAMALFIVVQQLENNLIVPMVMSKVVGLQPPVVIIALLIGAKLNGIGGAFLAIPVVIIAKIIFKEFLMAEEIAEEDLKN
jgi:predicted PurR-regulated permease PerM